MKPSAQKRGRARLTAPRVAAFLALLVAACGSRTGLLSPDETEVDGGQKDSDVPDNIITPFDGNSGFDSPITFDSTPPPPPPIDATVPDVPPPNDCPDADATLVYLLGQNNELYSFYPPTLAFTSIGTLACPVDNNGSPYSMAVDRKGKAYAIYTDSNLYEVSTATAACVRVPGWVQNQNGFGKFGMGFTGDQTSETLYVAQETDPTPMDQNPPSKGLGSIDVTTFVLTFVGPFSFPLSRCEFTGTGDNRLFAFCIDSDMGSTIAQIDPATGNVLGQNNLVVGTNADAFAFAYWGNSFWIFTGEGGGSTVTQYDLDTLTETSVATAPLLVVGAGVSTCAPR